MIEAVEVIGQIIDIGTEPVRRIFLPRILHRPGESGERLLERLFSPAPGRPDPEFCQIHSAVLLLIFCQNRLDPHHRVEDIRTRISLERAELLNVEHIVLRGLVGEIAVLQRSHGDLLRRPVRLLRADFRVGLDLLLHLLINIADECLEAHHAAVPGLERFSIPPVHGPEANVDQLRRGLHEPAFSRRAENLREVQRLPLVCHIQNLIRIILILPVQNGGEIRRRVERSAV